MKVRVVLTDVFDLAAPSAMYRRMEFAFGADGQSFWERFFPCNKAHLNDRVVYLFTGHQLKVLYNWWEGKYKTDGASIRQNLDFSKQTFFNTPVTGKSGLYGYSGAHVCCMKRRAGNRFELLIVYFGTPSDILMKSDVNFFHGKFHENFRDAECGVKLTELPVIRQAIEKKFGGPGKNDEKWLCYHGSGISEKDRVSLFEYCGDISACPFQR